MEKTRQGGLRILFADDEAHLRDLMQMELPRMGHEVTVCPDGAAALRALERGVYDAAMLDIRMPGLSGIDILGQIRQMSPDHAGRHAEPGDSDGRHGGPESAAGRGARFLT